MGLKRLIDACHHSGIAVVLDVVYQPSRAGGQLSGRVCSLLHLPISHALGRRDQFRRPGM